MCKVNSALQHAILHHPCPMQCEQVALHHPCPLQCEQVALHNPCPMHIRPTCPTHRIKLRCEHIHFDWHWAHQEWWQNRWLQDSGGNAPSVGSTLKALGIISNTARTDKGEITPDISLRRLCRTSRLKRERRFAPSVRNPFFGWTPTWRTVLLAGLYFPQLSTVTL